MLRKIFFLLIITTALCGFWLSSAILADAEWAVVRIEDEDAPELNGIYFADEKNGWVVGLLAFANQKGMIAHTKNGGATWELQEQPSEKSLSSVFFVSPKVGWAVGQDGTIIATKNGGKTWDFQTSKVNNWLYDVFFINEDVGWTVGMAETILKTTNGGKRWKVLRGGKPPSGVGEGELILKGVYFVDENSGWVVGQGGLILHTTDGGANWEKQESTIEENLNGVFFMDENTGCAVGASGLIVRTTDAGVTWKLQQSGTEEELFRVHFAKKSQEGWVVGEYGTILHSKDGGQTFQKLEPPINPVTKRPIHGEMRSVFTIDAKQCWVVSAPDMVLKYTK